MINGEGAMSYSEIQDHLENMTIKKVGSLLTLGNVSFDLVLTKDNIERATNF
jgi:hypothetical protein